jgi:hypothetical protein
LRNSSCASWRSYVASPSRSLVHHDRTRCWSEGRSGRPTGKQKVERLASAKSDHRIGLTSVLLHLGHLPAPSNETGLVKCLIYRHCFHFHRIEYSSCDCPIRASCDSRLRCWRQPDRGARAQWRFHRVMNRLAILQRFKGHFPLWSQK